MSVDADELALPAYEGKVIAGRYRVERLVGQGGMGSVWAGRHVTLNRLVAIKFIHPHLAKSPEALRRFDVEAKAAARLATRHAVAVLDHGITEDLEPYIVMEYLEGESLEHAIRRRGKFPLSEVVAIITQTAKALAAAHEQGIVHRDLKPDNIFLARDRDGDGASYSVKVVDFGIAKLIEDQAVATAATTQAGVILGTPHYMSPEALTASAPVGIAADVWSLGACAFAAACGSVPFEGAAIGDVVLKVCAAPLPSPSKLVPELPEAFDAWFERACARSILERFASVEEAARALGALEEERRHERVSYVFQPRVPAESVDLPAAEFGSRRGLLLAGILVGISVTLAALGYYVLERTRAADAEAARVAASARAVIEAENERKLREAERAYWARMRDAGPMSESGTKAEARKGAPSALASSGLHPRPPPPRASK